MPVLEIEGKKVQFDSMPSPDEIDELAMSFSRENTSKAKIQEAVNNPAFGLVKKAYQGLPFAKDVVSAFPGGKEAGSLIDKAPPATNFAGKAGEFAGTLVAAAPAILGAEALIPGKVLAGAVGFGAQTAGQASAEGAKPLEALGTGALTTGVTYAGGKALGLAGNAFVHLTDNMRGLSGRIGDWLVKLPVKAFRYGKDPLKVMAEEKVTGNTIHDLVGSYANKLETRTAELKNAVATSDKKVDLDSLVENYLKEAEANAKGSLQDRSSLKDKIDFMRQAITSQYGDLKNLSLSDAVSLKRQLADDFPFTVTDADGNILAKVAHKIHHGINEVIDKEAPEVGVLNEKVSSLIDIHKAVVNRAAIESRQNPLGLIGSLVSMAGLPAIGAGGYAATGHNPLEGAMIGIALKAGSSPAVMSRLAAGFSKIADVDKIALAKAYPWFVQALERGKINIQEAAKMMDEGAKKFGVSDLGLAGRVGARGNVIHPTDVEVLDPRMRPELPPPKQFQRQIGQGAPDVIYQGGQQEQLVNRQPQLPPTSTKYGEGFQMQEGEQFTPKLMVGAEMRTGETGLPVGSEFKSGAQLRREAQVQSEMEKARQGINVKTGDEPSVPVGKGYDPRTQQAKLEALQNKVKAEEQRVGMLNPTGENVIFTQNEYQKAAQRINMKLRRISANPMFDPEVYSDFITVGGYHIEAGARTFGKWASNMVRDLGARIRPYLRDLWKKLNDKKGVVDIGGSKSKDFINKDDYRYHKTSPKFLESIKSEGLKPSEGMFGNGVYFHPENKGAASESGLLIRIQKSKIPEYNEFVDTFTGKIDEGFTNKNVSPDYLEFSKDNGKNWEKIIAKTEAGENLNNPEFIRKSTDFEANSASGQRKARNSFPEKLGKQIVFMPYGPEGRGFYYVDSHSLGSTAKSALGIMAGTSAAVTGGAAIGNASQDVDMNKIYQIESSGNPKALNTTSGAKGLGQVTNIVVDDWNQAHPNDRVRYKQMYDPELNKKVASWYMNKRIPQLLKSRDLSDTLENRLIAYNAGVKKIGKTLKKETIDYLKKYKQAR